MPWLALPFESADTKGLLSDMLGIRGIPTLVLLDEEGGLISMDGVRLISEDLQVTTCLLVNLAVRVACGSYTSGRSGRVLPLGLGVVRRHAAEQAG